MYDVQTTCNSNYNDCVIINQDNNITSKLTIDALWYIICSLLCVLWLEWYARRICVGVWVNVLLVSHLYTINNCHTIFRVWKYQELQNCIEIKSKYYTCNGMGRHHLNLLDLLELGSDMEDAPTSIIVIWKQDLQSQCFF